MIKYYILKWWKKVLFCVIKVTTHSLFAEMFPSAFLISDKSLLVRASSVTTTQCKHNYKVWWTKLVVAPKETNKSKCQSLLLLLWDAVGIGTAVCVDVSGTQGF